MSKNLTEPITKKICNQLIHDLYIRALPDRELEKIMCQELEEEESTKLEIKIIKSGIITKQLAMRLHTRTSIFNFKCYLLGFTDN